MQQVLLFATSQGQARPLTIDDLGRLVLARPDLQVVAAQFALDQTNTQLIAAPASGHRLRLHDILTSTGSAGTVRFYAGSQLLFGLNLAANGGWSFNSVAGVPLEAAANLNVTSTCGSGPLYITVVYSVEEA